ARMGDARAQRDRAGTGKEGMLRRYLVYRECRGNEGGGAIAADARATGGDAAKDLRHGVEQRRVIRQQRGERARAVLRLRQEIQDERTGVGIARRDDRELARTRERVDADVGGDEP